jgi:hypothetical protein
VAKIFVSDDLILTQKADGSSVSKIFAAGENLLDLVDVEGFIRIPMSSLQGLVSSTHLANLAHLAVSKASPFTVFAPSFLDRAEGENDETKCLKVVA